MNEHITKATLDPYLNDTFEIHLEDGNTVELELIESIDESNDDSELFWFIFEGSADNPLPQHTYRLQHKTLGLLIMFLVPISGKNKETLCYQALFNRLKE